MSDKLSLSSTDLFVMIRFSLKVLRWFGFAAGCEAVATPRRNGLVLI
jgi:hypothetical protein